jgi:DNA-binding NtrC family response regulator
MQRLRRELDRIASSDAPVFISGESGAGKELVARTIHAKSARCEQPFVAVNCVSLSPTLIYAELFGYEKGAFTGAHRRKAGHLESAHRGTILLDEIGDLDSELQALLLRFLEEKTIRRVGGSEELPLDVRVIAATHVDIEAAVRAGRFREDLYYRLNVLRVHMPPLRERPHDIAQLARTFLARFGSERRGRPLRGFASSAVDAMHAYDWPGNVRELVNRIRRAIVMCEGPLISAADLQLAAGSPGHPVRDLVTARSQVEREALLAALRQSNWSASKAAALLGVSRATFYRLIVRHEISVEDSGQWPRPTALDPVKPS